MDFSEPQVVRQICRTVDNFIEQEIAPLEEEYDRFLGEDSEMHIIEGTGEDYRICNEYVELWQQIREKSAEAGIYTMHMPERVGGGGLGVLSSTIVIEHLENRHPDGFHHLMIAPGTVTEMMLPAYEDEYQREKYFEPMMRGEKLSCFALTEPNHGSDATYMETTAEKEGDEWVVNGVKAFASKGGVSDFLMVHARTSGDPGEHQGITTFLVDNDNPGVIVEKIQRSMGSKQPGRQSIIRFDDCRVPETQVLGEVDEGFTQLIDWIGMGRLTIPATAVGRSQWMLDASIEYAKQREVFEQQISRYQGVAFPLAELATDIQQARLLYRYAAWKVDQDENPVKEASMAKFQGAQVWNDAADLAVQVHGGAGIMRSLPFEREYRESRASRIYEGTDEIQKRTISKQLFK